MLGKVNTASETVLVQSSPVQSSSGRVISIVLGSHMSKRCLYHMGATTIPLDPQTFLVFRRCLK
ncbi:hypothetical protein E2C01_016516 [Portunus trituberculatus]|uniref:Uncharacterized protein n=1 Tax=Portunus trituberculatus TaxID=210409 RepID=A0A5B7DQR3_PORTR|nr:hypothetical protein [Portunus trituberculatus]